MSNVLKGKRLELSLASQVTVLCGRPQANTVAEWINTNWSSSRLPTILEPLSAGGFSPRELSGDFTNLAVRVIPVMVRSLLLSRKGNITLHSSFRSCVIKSMAEISGKSLDVPGYL